MGRRHQRSSGVWDRSIWHQRRPSAPWRCHTEQTEGGEEGGGDKGKVGRHGDTRKREKERDILIRLCCMNRERGGVNKVETC